MRTARAVASPDAGGGSSWTDGVASTTTSCDKPGATRCPDHEILLIEWQRDQRRRRSRHFTNGRVVSILRFVPTRLERPTPKHART